MPTTLASTATTDESETRAHPLRRAAVVSGVSAAAATTALAATADALGVPFAIDGETIPLYGFAQLTLVGALLGGLLAAASARYAASPRRTFTGVAVVLTVLSCIPSVAWPPDTATRLVLVATHVVAAAIMIPALAGRLRH